MTTQTIQEMLAFALMAMAIISFFVRDFEGMRWMCVMAMLAMIMASL